MNVLKVYTKTINNEEKKPLNQQCFLGAWYHKVFSSNDYWDGIEMTLTLPKVDIKRYKGKKNLDTPSIYMGGNAKYESDVGLSFMNALIKDENDKFVVSDGGYAFRPFWRFITDKEVITTPYDYENKKYYSESNLTPNETTSNCYGNYSPNFTEHYYLPGDKITMKVYSPKPDYLILEIIVIEESSLEESINKRKINDWNSPKDFESPMMSSPGHNIHTKKSYKRVNAIDQSGNEGKPTILTNTTVKDAIYESCYLYRQIEGITYKVPFNNRRTETMNCPDEKGFNNTKISDETGATAVNITPNVINND